MFHSIKFLVCPRQLEGGLLCLNKAIDGLFPRIRGQCEVEPSRNRPGAERASLFFMPGVCLEHKQLLLSRSDYLTGKRYPLYSWN